MLMTPKYIFVAKSFIYRMYILFPWGLCLKNFVSFLSIYSVQFNSPIPEH